MLVEHTSHDNQRGHQFLDLGVTGFHNSIRTRTFACLARPGFHGTNGLSFSPQAVEIFLGFTNTFDTLKSNGPRFARDAHPRRGVAHRCAAGEIHPRNALPYIRLSDNGINEHILFHTDHRNSVHPRTSPVGNTSVWVNSQKLGGLRRVALTGTGRDSVDHFVKKATTYIPLLRGVKDLQRSMSPHCRFQSGRALVALRLDSSSNIDWVVREGNLNVAICSIYAIVKTDTRAGEFIQDFVGSVLAVVLRQGLNGSILSLLVQLATRRIKIPCGVIKGDQILHWIISQTQFTDKNEYISTECLHQLRTGGYGVTRRSGTFRSMTARLERLSPSSLTSKCFIEAVKLGCYVAYFPPCLLPEVLTYIDSGSLSFLSDRYKIEKRLQRHGQPWKEVVKSASFFLRTTEREATQLIASMSTLESDAVLDGSVSKNQALIPFLRHLYYYDDRMKTVMTVNDAGVHEAAPPLCDSFVWPHQQQNVVQKKHDFVKIVSHQGPFDQGDALFKGSLYKFPSEMGRWIPYLRTVQ
ncbi:hypothetical protein SEMRO_404_G135870.1 [Seminavis robusta]|uniref:Uncharacterized protein n=1 Tax=Seminavis robusta TaxID=568900 RepID=A0A9N8HGL6_9STRA|nr:hypothetical protein SEMRO_404_G135870.1 [Seminavis robusta]|eukprot:Sro404_g135870.1 n/a (524) ;mRNA; f:16757-18328